jgi:MoxR-like ATPase
MMKVIVGYPTDTQEHAIVDRALRPAESVRAMLTPADLIRMRERVQEIYVDPAVVDYAVQLVSATRRTFAAGLPDDVADLADLAFDVLRHRIVLSYEALADDISADLIITKVLDAVPAPEVALSGR